jgi:hypothetical protein
MTVNTPGGSKWPARCAYTAAALFSGASGITNLLYGIAKGSDFGSSLVWATVSIAVSIVFALSWPAVLISADRKQWSRAAMAVIALLLTGTYSVSAALGSAMGGRANAAIEEKDTTDKRTKAQTAYNVATAELASLKPSRPVAEIEAVVEAAKPICRIVVATGYRGESCTKPAALTAELGRAKRRVELEQKIEQSTADLAKTGPARVANADAVALSTYLQAIGLGVDAERVNKLLVLLATVVVECGSGLALAVGLALSDAGRSGQSDTATIQGERSLTEQATEGANANPERAPGNTNSTNGLARPPTPNDRPTGSAHDRVLSALRSKNGVLFGSQVALGAAFGWSKTRLHEVLHELEAAGRVRLSVSRQGTAVRLVAGSA